MSLVVWFRNRRVAIMLKRAITTEIGAMKSPSRSKSLYQEADASTPVTLDETDEHLVLLLQKEGRLSYSDLGKAVGLTAGGARVRVKRLEERGILRVIGVTSAYELGLRSIGMLQIDVVGDIDVVADQLGGLDGVRYVVFGFGSFNILAEVYASTPTELFSLVNRTIREIPGVVRLETFVYHSVHTHKPVFSLSSSK